MARTRRTRAPRAAGLIHSAGSWRRIWGSQLGAGLAFPAWSLLVSVWGPAVAVSTAGSGLGRLRRGLLHEGGDLLPGGCAYCTKAPPNRSTPDPPPVAPDPRAVDDRRHPSDCEQPGHPLPGEASSGNRSPPDAPVSWDGARTPHTQVPRPGASCACGDISVRPGTDDAVGDGIAVPDGVECPRPEGRAPGRAECPRRRREPDGYGCSVWPGPDSGAQARVSRTPRRCCYFLRRSPRLEPEVVWSSWRRGWVEGRGLEVAESWP